MATVESPSKLKLPIIVHQGLKPGSRQRFEQQFTQQGRDQLELLWRRTQQPETAKWSGAQSSNDRRRRMVHALDRYDVVENSHGEELGVKDPYVWFQTASPGKENEEYLQNLKDDLANNGWETEEAHSDLGRNRRGELSVVYQIKSNDSHDTAEGRTFPEGYTIFEMKITGGNDKLPEEEEKPWGVLRSGIRQRGERGQPVEIDNLKNLERFFPMQVELGCGPSIEAGVPPLHYLHTIYSVTTPITHEFTFGPHKDTFPRRIVSDPEGFYNKAAKLYAAALTAEPTPFYRLMAELKEKGIIVGDVFTNNFDGLLQMVGLEEKYIRKFEESAIRPKVEFHPDAKSLLVIGSHADRRGVQQAAREKMPVIYVDPEGYTDEHNNFVSYPLEGIKTGDYLVRKTAEQFTNSWRQAFKNNTK